MGRGITHIQVATKAQKKADRFAKHLAKCANGLLKSNDEKVKNKKYVMNRDVVSKP